MHCTNALEQILSDLRIPDFCITDQTESLVKRAKVTFQNIVESKTVLIENAKTIGKLVDEEAKMRELVRGDCEKLCKMREQMKELEIAAEKWKEIVDVKRKEQQNIFQSIKLSANIKTTLANDIMDRLGFRLKLKLIEIDGEKIFEVMFLFREDKSTILHYDPANYSYCLKSIEPPHPAFEQICEFLETTQDIHGFLGALKRHHFDRIA